MKHTIIYLHGVGGPDPTQAWLRPLNARLAKQYGSRLTKRTATIVEPRFDFALRSPAHGECPPATWKYPGEDDYELYRARYLVLKAELESIARRYEDPRPGAHYGQVPKVGQRLAGRAVSCPLHDAYRYRSDRAARQAVWRAVLDAFPEEGSVVVVAHSLGSVVAVDLLKRLPENLTVDLLLTLGSPLTAQGLWQHVGEVRKAFPFDRVRAWVNLYDTRDAITAGRGISELFPQALDVAVDLGGSHDAAGYCSHPVTAAVLGHVLYNEAAGLVRTNLPARPIGRNWQLHMLAFAYSQELSRTWRNDRWRSKLRFDTAREIAAHRLTNEAGDIQASSPAGPQLGQPPSFEELMDHSAENVRHLWTDEELLPFCVSLQMNPAVAPFDLAIDVLHRQIALKALLARVRRRSRRVSHDQYAEAVAEAVMKAHKAMRDHGNRWVWLLPAGALVLALTGVGLWVALPTGLAGAAVITSTLAAFGPGGMVGGMLTLAGSTGAGSALISAGATGTAASRRKRVCWQRAVASGLAEYSANELRSVLTGMLAVVEAQRELDFTSSAPDVEQILSAVYSRVTAELAMHQEVAPNRDGTKEWRNRAEVVQQALVWLRDNYPKEERLEARLAIEFGPQ